MSIESQKKLIWYHSLYMTVYNNFLQKCRSHPQVKLVMQFHMQLLKDLVYMYLFKNNFLIYI